MLRALWKTEPVLLTLAGSAAFWAGLFLLLAAFGHPVSHDRQDAIAGLAVIIAGLIARSQVSPVQK